MSRRAFLSRMVGTLEFSECEEMITVEELTEDTVASQPLPAVSTPVHH
jgi:hypothetical protein